MANRLEQPSKRDEKNQTGCIRGFINILDFRHGRSTRRLLEDTSTGIKVAGAVYSRSILQKLICPYRESQEFYDGEGKDSLIAGAAKTSVKELMEEEMFSEQEQNEQSIADTQAKEFGSERKGCVKMIPKRTSRTTKSFCDMHCELDAARSIGSESDIHQYSEKETNLDVGRDWSNGFDIRSEQAYSVFDRKVIEAIKVFLDQRLTVGKHLTEYEKTEHSNEFMNALQTLSSNKELILKLLQDPNSLLVKHIEDLEDAQLEKDQNPNTIAKYCLINRDIKVSKPAERVMWKKHSFFRRKSKSREQILLKEHEDGQTSNRIVILKPGPASTRICQPEVKLLPLRSSHRKVQTKRIASRFFFTRIKRKLKHAMAKERHKVPSDDMSRRFFRKHQNSGSIGKGIGGGKVGWNSPNRSRFCNENFATLPTDINNKENSCKPNDTETSMGIGKSDMEYSKLGVYCNDLYIEAKKHLSEMLSDGDEIQDFSSRQLPKTLGRILSLPHFNSSTNFVTGQRRFLLGNCFHKDSSQLTHDEDVFHLGPSRENSISRSCTAENPENTVPSSNLKSDVLGELSNTNAFEATLSSLRPEKSNEADEIVEITDASVQEESKFLDLSVEQCSCSVIRDEQDGDLTEICHVDDYAQCSTSDSFEERRLLPSPLPSPPSSSIINLVGDLDRSNEKPERHSPVSVLDPSFTDDDMSPSILKSQSVELSLQPRKIIFHETSSSATNQENEESSFDYVEAVLLASDLNWAEYLSRWLASDQILDASLFHEVQLFSSRSHHDQKLLFDCTNEILKEVCDRYFGSSPWISFVKHNIRPIPRGKRLVREVWDGVEWFILSHSYSSTLEKIVGKDMSKAGTWMDLRFDVENIGIELGEAIFEELVDEIIWTSVYESPETHSFAHPVEFIKFE